MATSAVSQAEAIGKLMLFQRQKRKNSVAKMRTELLDVGEYRFSRAVSGEVS